MDSADLSTGLTRLGLNIEADMIDRIKSMGGTTSLEAMARVGLNRDAPRLESSSIPSVPTMNSSQSKVGDAIKGKPLEKAEHPLKIQLVEDRRPLDTRIRSPPSPIKRHVPVDVSTTPGIRQDFPVVEKSHTYPAHQQSTVAYSVRESVPSGDVRPNRKHFEEPDHLNPKTEISEADNAYTRPNKKHYAKSNYLDEGIPCPAEPRHIVGTRRRGQYGHRKGLVITSNLKSFDDFNKTDIRAERRHEPADEQKFSIAGVESARAVQSLKNIHEQYGVNASFSAVPPIHWRRGRSNDIVGKENRDFSAKENSSVEDAATVAGTASPNCRGKAIHDVNKTWGADLHDMDPSIEPYNTRGRRSVNTEEVKAEVEARLEASCGTRAKLLTAETQKSILQFHDAKEKPFIFAPEVYERLTKRMYKDSTKSGVFDGTANTIQPPRAADISGLPVSAYNSNAIASHLRMSPGAARTSAEPPLPAAPDVPAAAAAAATVAAATAEGTATDTALPPPPPPSDHAESRHFTNASATQDDAYNPQHGLKRRARPTEHPRGHSMTYYSAIHSDLGCIMNHEAQTGDGPGPSQNPFRAPRPVTGKVGVSSKGFAASRSAGGGNKDTVPWACLANTERKFLETRNHPMLGRPRGAPEPKRDRHSTAQNDTWKSDMSSVLQHGLGQERGDKFAAPGKSRAPIKMVSNRVTSLNDSTSVDECAGRPTRKVRDAGLTRVPWFRSSSKAS